MNTYIHAHLNTHMHEVGQSDSQLEFKPARSENKIHHTDTHSEPFTYMHTNINKCLHYPVIHACIFTYI